MQLFAVIIRGRVGNLGFNLFDAALDLVRRPGAFDNGRVVFVNRDPFGFAEVVQRDAVELDAKIIGNHLAVGQNGNVFQHRFAAVAEARRFHGGHIQRAAQFVDHEGRQRFAFHVFRDNHERFAHARHLFQNREQVFHAADLFLIDQNVRVIENRFHPFRVGHKIGREIAAIKLHPFHHVQRGFHAFRFFHRDDAVFADFIHRFGDDFADGGIVIRGDRADLFDFQLAFHRLADLFQFRHDRLDGLVNAAFQIHRVGARRDIFAAFAENRLRQHGRRRRAIARDIAGFAGDFVHEARAHVFERIRQFDFFGDGHAVFGAGGSAEFFVNHHVAAFGPEGNLDSVC
ncbi:hypothetical protein U14_01430 [Candidatus Moduliflexus flocculans]|uniref:Uncharacterized protein n=1 Tax=Candidatus Moduliflexus flocculans TaxID=1499966 RepID=A0A0S6VS35_9BACT|nr:hypothetical protein U14_01430 [Candidatus Moduliflexus flocculans]